MRGRALASVLSVASAALVTAVSAFGETFDKAAHWEAWRKFASSYEPDISDSLAELEPPATGRIAQPIRIAEKGKALAGIVVDLSSANSIDAFFPDVEKTGSLVLRAMRGHEREVLRTAALELRENLRLVTGAEFPVVERASDGKRPRLYLGASFAKAPFAEDLKALAAAPAKDGFAVRAKDGDVYIFGVTPAGTLYGTLAFVENNTDLIWAFPGKAGTVFTARDTLDVVWADAREIPVFVTRGWDVDATWMMHNRANFHPADPVRGFFHLPGGHYLCPQYYDFSVGLRKFNSMDEKGVRSATWDEMRDHACLADPEFVRHAFETVPNVSESAYRDLTCVFGMDDNAAVCHCPKCTAPIRALDGTMLTPDKDKEIFWSAWFYTYLNKMDEAIQKIRPGFVTSTYAYFFAFLKPPIAIRKTIVPWICTYPRSLYKEPVFSPGNVRWQTGYEGWAEHSPECFLYDYYGLYVNGEPYAEIYREELAYQRAIGLLSTGTEGGMGGDELGAADERWVMARLAWNPDLNVESLHRRFNRRTYHEAAPHFDRLRGALRRAYYRGAAKNLTECVKDPAVRTAVVAELDGAATAAKNPRARILAERCVAAWRVMLGLTERAASNVEGVWRLKENKESVSQTDLGERCFDLTYGATLSLTGAGWDGKLLRVRVRPLPGVFESFGYPEFSTSSAKGVRGDACDSVATALPDGQYEFLLRPASGAKVAFLNIGGSRMGVKGWRPPSPRVQILSLAPEEDDERLFGASAKPPQLTDALVRKFKRHYAKADDAAALLPDGDALRARRIEAFFRDVDENESLSTAEAVCGLRTAIADETVRSHGVSHLMNDSRSGCGRNLIVRLAEVFAKRGNGKAVCEIFHAWERWDGQEPVSIRYRRSRELIAFLKARPALKATLADEWPVWRKLAETCATEAGDARTRGEAALEVLRLGTGEMPVAARAQRIRALVADEYMPNDIRAAAVRQLKDVLLRADGKTDWAAVERELKAVILSGDWSNLTRQCYSRQSGDDLQLDALCETVEAMRKAGEGARAKALFAWGEKELKYVDPPAKRVAAEAATQPRLFDPIELSAVKRRYSVLERCRASFAPIRPAPEEEDGISLDE